MPFMDLGDVTIHYQEAGEGPFAYIFCHGLGGGGMGFTAEFGFWQQQFGRVLTWDNRGVGQSSTAQRYSLPLFASDLARLMDRLGIEQAVVHGVSWGGVLVQQFALDYPDKCAALIIDSSSSEVNVAASENWYQIGENTRLGAPGGREVSPEQIESLVARARGIAGLREHPYTPRLKEIVIPVLVVGGGRDAVAGAGGSVVMARNLPVAKLEIVEDSGHGVYSQKPDVFRSLAVAFCREHGVPIN